MFFIKEGAMKKRNAFFKRLLANLLFIIQLIAILLLAFSAATPLLNMTQNRTEEHAVLIIDGSASMQAKFGLSTRFGEAIKEAKSIIGNQQKVSIILAENMPITLLDKGKPEQAIDLLNKIQPSETTSNIEDAMFQAMTLMDGGSVYVLSDFSSTSDPIIAKRQLTSKKINVIYKEFNEPVSNIGIVDIEVDDRVKLKIKNFNKKAVKINVKGPNSQQEVTLTEQGVEEIYFDLQPGNNVFKLDIKDDFTPDNIVYVSVPDKKRIKTLYVTNNEEKDYLKTALESLNKLEITKANLPIIPTDFYKLYFFKDIDATKLLPATFNDIVKKTKEGSSIIIHLQPDSGKIDYKGAGLMTLTGIQDNANLLKKDYNSITSEVEFGSVEMYYTTSNVDCDKWVVANNNTIICNKQINDGNILYYGILEDKSDFKNTPDYPLFWSYLIDYLVPEEEDYDLNIKTGQIFGLLTQDVTTPTGNIKSDKVITNRMGFYNYDNKTVAANLIDFDESNINVKTELSDDKSINVGAGFGESKQSDITKSLIWVALIFVLIEIIIVKWRGDL